MGAQNMRNEENDLMYFRPIRGASCSRSGVLTRIPING